MSIRITMFATAFVLATTGLAIADHHQTERSFEASLQAHMDAVTNRDLDAYIDTITTGEDLTIIFPGGEIMRTRDEAIAFHTEWFATPGWTMTFEVDRIVESHHMAVASLRATYTDEAGPRVNWLTLVFEEQAGEWRLVFDQNTRDTTWSPEVVE